MSESNQRRNVDLDDSEPDNQDNSRLSGSIDDQIYKGSNKVHAQQHHYYAAMDFAPQLRKNQPMTDSIRALLASNEGSQ